MPTKIAEIGGKQQGKYASLPKFVKKFLGHSISRNEFQLQAEKLEAKEPIYPVVAVTELSLLEVESALKLTYDAEDTEMQEVPALPLPPHLGIQSKI